MSSRWPLHRLAKLGDADAVEAWLDAHPDAAKTAINAYNDRGETPLMCVVGSARSAVALVDLLLVRGARIDLPTRSVWALPHSVLELAIGAGSVDVVRRLIELGADVRAVRKHGYTAMHDAAYSRVEAESRQVQLIELLAGHGAALDGITTYGESALRICSNRGRFKAVACLLAAGADESQLSWTPLACAAALGTLEDVCREFSADDLLEAPDYWQRTPLLIALQRGEIDIARWLYEQGASLQARGRCGKPALFYAIESGTPEAVAWLMAQGADVDAADEFGQTALVYAAETAADGAVAQLVTAGADIHRQHNGGTALTCAAAPQVTRRLIESGADLQFLSQEGRRVLLGLPPDPDEDLLGVTRTQFLRGRDPRFGCGNPERIDEPFWINMIRAGVTGWAATQAFDGPSSMDAGPVWCAQRFGQSITFLPDGRIVQIGGEHEDDYDPDFRIYNDVFVHHPDGRIEVFGYPEADFPPTDFHTATLIDRFIYIVGSLGYPEARRYGQTPVYRLELDTWRIEHIDAAGDAPGWIYKHRAISAGTGLISVSGGSVLEKSSGQLAQRPNSDTFAFDVVRRTWRRL